MLWGSDDQATLRNPYPAYAQLRASAPWYDHPDGYTVVSRYHDVLAAMAHEHVGYGDDPVQGVASRAVLRAGQGAAPGPGCWEPGVAHCIADILVVWPTRGGRGAPP
jgi:hypothetical protein